MIGVDKLSVALFLEDQEMEVGELVLSNRKIYFKYSSGFLSRRLNISPVKLPFSDDILSAESEPFDGLFGVFNDSLPDGWGKLLLDRSLSSKGINIARITPWTDWLLLGLKEWGHK